MPMPSNINLIKKLIHFQLLENPDLEKVRKIKQSITVIMSKTISIR